MTVKEFDGSRLPIPAGEKWKSWDSQTLAQEQPRGADYYTMMFGVFVSHIESLLHSLHCVCLDFTSDTVRKTHFTLMSHCIY